eukprot:CAMPEP_0173187486 /NCGR_PEP_ID=MMETSP1141-20130122/10734_1 /TAXON_ID=483371 /ORGANISM="non described non described, Strain CCMP2298" /LENGTH=120 /DNA_ID=CAMNT_0014111325 /DNA_START=391 /DNA_END=753 /DNA_ORIENTATION=-
MTSSIFALRTLCSAGGISSRSTMISCSGAPTSLVFAGRYDVDIMRRGGPSLLSSCLKNRFGSLNLMASGLGYDFTISIMDLSGVPSTLTPAISTTIAPNSSSGCASLRAASAIAFTVTTG